MVNRTLYEYHVNLHNPDSPEPTQETVHFFTYWSPVKKTMLEIAEACAAQETATSGLRRQSNCTQRFIPTGPAELKTDYIFPPVLTDLEEILQ